MNNASFPVTLLIAERRCLVVGGGKIATRKAELLLHAGAEVTVVSPHLSPVLQDHAAAGRLTCRERAFKPADTEGIFLAFAATNNRKVNREVLEACREQGILVCAVDKGWVDGDFVTPAVLRKDELTVSISTGGKSCRRSRMVKENLAHHIEMVDSADLLVIGTSHNYMSVAEREAYHLEGEALAKTGSMLAHVWGIHEFMVLNTCNRVELLAVVSSSDEVEQLARCILGFDKLNPEVYYLKRGTQAFAHSCELIAGLLSQSPGEKHIAGQVKQALAAAGEAEWAGSMLDEWIASAQHVSKHIRQKTEPILHSFEIEDSALDYLTAKRPGFAGQRILILGTGEIGTGIVERLLKCDSNLVCDWLYHRNKPEAPDAWRDRLRIGSLNDLKERLGEVDIVISAAGGGQVLHQAHAPFFDQEKDVFLLDLAMPRSIAPELERLSSALKVADLDDLKHWRRREAVDLNRVFETCCEVIEEHRGMYEKILNWLPGR